MQINFTGKDFEVTPALRSHITEKFATLERHFKNIQTVHVILRIEKTTQVAEANLRIDSVDINATAGDNNMYHAIDQLTHKLMTQLTKHKERIQEKRV